jgi:hypothetical protein
MIGALAAPFLFSRQADTQLAGATISPTPIQHFVDNNGNALSGGKLFTYAAGTTTKLATFTDGTGLTPNTNPIILNSRGEAQIWLSGGSYKYVLAPSTDTDPPTNPIWTIDRISGTGTTTLINAPVVCGSDNASILNAAVTLLPNGGDIVVPSCPFTVSNTVTLTNNIHLHGTGAVYYPGMLDQSPTGPPVAPTWPPTTSSAAINCTSTVNVCIRIAGIGAEVDHINFGNPQPAPPTSGTYIPTLFPFIIATNGTTNTNGLYIHDLTFTAASQCIDIEGTPNYLTVGIAGAQGTINNIWMNPCLNVGIRQHLVDNTWRITNVDMDFWWYRNNVPVGAYMENNSIGLDLQYAANTEFTNIEFLFNKIAVRCTNGSVIGSGGPGTKTIGCVNIQFTNADFNEVCQAFSAPAGTFATAVFTNTIAAEDNTDCGGTVPGTPPAAFFSMPSDLAFVTMMGVMSQGVQTFASIGAGTGGNLSISGLNVQSYSTFAAGAPAFKIGAGAHFTLAATDYTAIVPSAGAGPLEGPGEGGTQGYMQPIFVGSGSVCGEGGAALTPSGSSNSGYVAFYPCAGGAPPAPAGGSPSGRNGYVGYSNNLGVNLAADNGAVFLLPNTSNASSPKLSVGSTGTTLQINVNGLPTSCSGQPVGTLWTNAGVIQAC